MSKIKSPPEKKELSLNRDCRNIYGENSKSSRKNIRKGKQRVHMQERRTTKTQLLPTTLKIDEDLIVEAEIKASQRAILAKREGFRKTPDKPLKTVLGRKRENGVSFIAMDSELLHPTSNPSS